MDIVDTEKTKRMIDQFLVDLPATNDMLSFIDGNRIIHMSLCRCEKGSVINTTVENKR